MGSNSGKLMIESEFMQFELNLQNNYKDKAYQNYIKVHDMLDSFLEQGEISRWYYGRMKKKLKKYDVLYEPEQAEK